MQQRDVKTTAVPSCVRPSHQKNRVRILNQLTAVADNSGTFLDVLFIRVSGSRPGFFFDHDLVARFDQRFDKRRDQGHPVLTRITLFGNGDDHILFSLFFCSTLGATEIFEIK